MNMQLRAAREASGKTQSQVAKEIGVSELSYQRYEYGQREPRAAVAIQIAEALGVKSFEKFKAIFGAATPDSPKTE